MGIKAWFDRNFRPGTWLDMRLGCLLVIVLMFCLSAINMAYMSWRVHHGINTKFSAQIFSTTFYIGAPITATIIVLVAVFMKKLSLKHTWLLLWLGLISWVFLRLQATPERTSQFCP